MSSPKRGAAVGMTKHANIARNFERCAIEKIDNSGPQRVHPGGNGPKARKARAISYAKQADKHWVRTLIQVLRFLAKRK